jgi:hypothetical protein
MLKYLLSLILIVACLEGAHAQKIRAVPDDASAHILSIKKAIGNLPSKVETDGGGVKSTLTLTYDKAYEAYVLCVPSGSNEVTDCVRRVFVTDLRMDLDYEITGEELFIEAGRPIDNLKWTDAHTLSYERWTGPHFGHRYVVDIKTMKQTGAFVLSDQ